MKIVDKILLLFLVFCAGLINGTIIRQVMADTGDYNATRVCVGNVGNTHRFIVSDGTTVNIATEVFNRCDLTCFNNSAAVIAVGTSAIAGTAVAALQVQGIPWLSSATARFGAITSSVTAVLVSPAGSSSTVTCWEGITR